MPQRKKRTNKTKRNRQQHVQGRPPGQASAQTSSASSSELPAAVTSTGDSSTEGVPSRREIGNRPRKELSSFERGLQGAFCRPRGTTATRPPTAKPKTAQRQAERQSERRSENVQQSEGQDYGRAVQAMFLAAVAAGDCGAVSTFLDMGLNPNQPLHVLENEVWLPLCMAAWNDKPDVMELLLDNGADVRGVNQHRETALHIACESGSVDAVKLLVRYGADINAKNEFSATAFHRAAVSNNAEIIHLLVKCGAKTEVSTHENATALHFAVQDNCQNAAKALIACGADPNVADNCGRTPLMVAIPNADCLMMEILIEAGADVRYQCAHDGFTPLDVALMLAAAPELQPPTGSGEYFKKIKLLASHGASFGLCNPDRVALACKEAISSGETASAKLLLNSEVFRGNTIENFKKEGLLILAAHAGDTEVGKVLLQRGISTDPDGDSLVIAIRSDQLEFVRLLLQQCKATYQRGGTNFNCCLHVVAVGQPDDQVVNEAMIDLLLDEGVNIDSHGEYCQTPLHVAAEKGKVLSVKALIKRGANVDAVDDQGHTPLILACHKNQLDAVKELIVNGASLESGNDIGNRALEIAALEGHEELVKYLLSKGAPLNRPSLYGKTPLLQAVTAGHVGVTKTLLNAGAEISCHTGKSFAYRAVGCNNLEILQLIVEAGDDVNEGNIVKETPLFLACELKSNNAARYLLEHGADPNCISESMQTPLLLSCQLGNEEMVKILLKHGALPHSLMEACVATEPPLFSAITRKQYNITDLLIGHGADVNDRWEGQTCLIEATKDGRADLVALLVKNKADVDAVLSTGEAAIHQATENNDSVIVKQLVEAGASVNLATAKGTTPLHIASQNGCIRIVNLLLAHGADPLLKNKDSMTPMLLASRNGHSEIAKILLPYMPSKSLTVVKVSSDMEDTLKCPITLEIMTDPVVAEDGHSYERAAITKWLQSNDLSPMTKQPLSINCLIPNLNLKQQILAYLESRAMLE